MTRLAKVLAFSSATEAGTGLAFLVVPAVVVRLLLAAEPSGVGTVVSRAFGIALLGLAAATWPAGGAGTAAARRGMVVYNAGIALYLGWIGWAGTMKGPLLWPVVALHAVVALLLVGSRPDPSA